MTNDHEDPSHRNAERRDAPGKTHTIQPKGKDSGAGKWLAGAAIVALLVGGGYLISQNTSAPTQQAAMIDENFDASAPSENLVAETASAPSETSATPAAETAAARRIAANAPAEEVIGISSGSAATGDSEEIIVPGARRPVWAQRPSARRLSESYPYRALERGQEGEAQVSCTVGETGAMRCVEVSETPANAGFGSAAVRIAQMHRHADQRADGSAAAGTPVNMRVLFRVGEDGRRF